VSSLVHVCSASCSDSKTLGVCVCVHALPHHFTVWDNLNELFLSQLPQ